MTDEIDLTPKVKMQLAWDLIDHDKIVEWLPKLGLVPPSEEGLEMDHIDSHRRAVRVRPLLPLIGAYTSMISDIHATYIIDSAAELLPAETREESTEAYKAVAFQMMQSAVLATVAELMDNGVIAYGPAVDS